jgi:hypothetical protein
VGLMRETAAAICVSDFLDLHLRTLTKLFKIPSFCFLP